ncbi:gp507 [Bacillus phage G]|uniref:Gp507 n=1 Tax=Bacillus phage G TaxID=2884420 RepID=G3MAP8_9CAUD|nr:gp507 [Bacillus phage G]AEO93765.1 gp507 [Bacillus phage G]
MATWVYIERIKKQPFFTLSDFNIINYHEIVENVIEFNKGIDELSDYPSMKEARRYFRRLAGETKEEFYERVLIELPARKARYEKYKEVLDIKGEEYNYLKNSENYEEIFFVKRQYELEDMLKECFREEFKENNNYPILLDEYKLEQFNFIADKEFEYDEEYLYKLHVC